MRSQIRASTIFNGHRHITANERMGRWLLFGAYVANVLSNSELLRAEFPGALKHGFLVLAALISLVRMPKRSLLAMFVASPLALIYVLGEMELYAVMVLTLAAASPIMWAAIRSVVDRRDYRYILALAVVSLIPAALNWQTFVNEGFFSTMYGRPRMLMGYFHPKEAAVAFAIPMLLFMMTATSAHTIFWMFAIVFLWAVGSRNTAMIVFLGWALRWHGRVVIAATLILIPASIIWLAVSNNWYDTLDNLMSLRLTNWGEILQAGRVVADADLNFSDRFAADNFFVEAYVLIGGISIVLTMVWVALWGAIVGRTVQLRSWAWIAFAMLLFNACFDSGIASTGNLTHVFLWAVMCSPIFASKRRTAPPQAVAAGASSTIVPTQ
ncbi:hypothetical protein [Pandoraea sputorum]|uniref:hypothetical protein n=1 Tax=Pandoraea sputorum TaxID=93222 RepID=UPI0030C6B54C